MVAATLSHSEIIATVQALRPEYVTSQEVERNPSRPSMRFAVAAIDEAGTYKNFDVCVPLAVAYRAQMATQKTLDEKYGRVWTVLSAIYTNDQF